MINYIKNLFKKKLENNKILEISNHQNIIDINFIFDLETENIIPIFNVVPYDFIKEESKFLSQAETFAALLNDFCGDNNYIKDLLIDSMEIMSKQSENHSLFVNNVLFFWRAKYEIQKQKDRKNRFPLIRPINVFRNK